MLADEGGDDPIDEGAAALPHQTLLFGQSAHPVPPPALTRA
jgi:hypothetical protein